MHVKPASWVTGPADAPEPGPPYIYAISSGKGGVGKTSITVNLAYALAGQGSRVLVVDGDLGLANIDVLLGLTVATTISDVLERGQEARVALVQVEPNLAILPAASGVPEMVNLAPQDREVLEELLLALGQGFHYVLIDTAAGIGHSVLWFNALADCSLVVLTPDPTSLTDAYALIKVLCQRQPQPHVMIVVNQVASEQEAQQVYDHLKRVTERFLGVTPLYAGAVPKAPEVIQGVRQQTPFLKSAPGGKATQAVRALAGKLGRQPGDGR